MSEAGHNKQQGQKAERAAAAKTCFVICPVGDPLSETRKRSDQVFKHVITPAAEACGYKVVRADKLGTPGMIGNQIIQHLRDDELVVADLTDHNANVFYELAIRHMVKKPLVQIIAADQRIPFDVAQTRTIPLDYHDLDSAAACREHLQEQIRAVEVDASLVDNPISVAIDLETLRQSGDPSKEATAQMLQLLQGIDAKLRLMNTAGALSRSPIYDTFNSPAGAGAAALLLSDAALGRQLFRSLQLQLAARQQDLSAGPDLEAPQPEAGNEG
jgi:hypothetical protein